jgi:hypothetical protein
MRPFSESPVIKAHPWLFMRTAATDNRLVPWPRFALARAARGAGYSHQAPGAEPWLHLAPIPHHVLPGAHSAWFSTIFTPVRVRTAGSAARGRGCLGQPAGPTRIRRRVASRQHHVGILDHGPRMDLWAGRGNMEPADREIPPRRAAGDPAGRAVFGSHVPRAGKELRAGQAQALASLPSQSVGRGGPPPWARCTSPRARCTSPRARCTSPRDALSQAVLRRTGDRLATRRTGWLALRAGLGGHH